jgi:HK97 family phage portal protein
MFSGRRSEERGVAERWDEWWSRMLDQFKAATGRNVTNHSAMKVSAFYACVRIIAEDCAKLPLFMFERTAEGREKAENHSLFRILHRAPNPEMTSFELRETVGAHLVGTGNGYLFIERDRANRVLSLWPLRPDRVRFEDGENTNGRRFYEYTLGNGQTRILLMDQVCHLRGLGFDGRRGYSPVIQGRQTIALAEAAEVYAGTFFANDATPRVVLKTSQSFKGKEDVGKNIRESWESRLRGLERSHLLGILEEGMDIEKIGINPEDAQLLGSREFSTEDVGRWFRMPPHKLGALRRATFSNIEHQGLEYLTDTLLPWLTRWEQRLAASLLTREEQNRYFIEHIAEGILRGDFKAQMEGFRIGREIGLYSVNDLLSLKNMNQIGPEGDLRHIPLNWITLTATPAEEPPPEPDERSDLRHRLERFELRNEEFEDRYRMVRSRLRTQYARLIEDRAREIAAREAADVGRAADRILKGDSPDVERWRSWVTEFYEKHLGFIRDKLAPVLEVIAQGHGDAAEDLTGEVGMVDRSSLTAFAQDYLTGEKGRAREWTGVAAGTVIGAAIRAIDEEADPIAAVREVLQEWKELRSFRWRDQETVRAGEAFTRVAFTALGVRRWRWRAGERGCPFSRKLDGEIREIGDPFLTAGEVFTANGDTIEPASEVNHAPLCRGCDCMIVPVIGDES